MVGLLEMQGPTAGEGMAAMKRIPSLCTAVEMLLLNLALKLMDLACQVVAQVVALDFLATLPREGKAAVELGQ